MGGIYLYERKLENQTVLAILISRRTFPFFCMLLLPVLLLVFFQIIYICFRLLFKLHSIDTHVSEITLYIHVRTGEQKTETYDEDFSTKQISLAGEPGEHKKK